MPFGGNDWLALTQEPALEPELPICDPHHHFWDSRTTRIPYQRYLLHELADDMRRRTDEDGLKGRIKVRRVDTKGGYTLCRGGRKPTPHRASLRARVLKPNR